MVVNRGVLAVFLAPVLCALLGHLAADRALAVPDRGICPLLPNTTCPECFTVTIFGANIPCHQVMTEEFRRCETGDDPCTNNSDFACSGVVNSAEDCSGLNFPENPCSGGGFKKCNSP